MFLSYQELFFDYSINNQVEDFYMFKHNYNES